MGVIGLAIWVLVIIGAFMINIVLGLIVLLGSIFVLFGGLDEKKPEIYPHTLNPAQLEKYKKDNQASLYRLICISLSNGSSDKDLTTNKYVKKHALAAGIPIDGAESINSIKTSKAFLVQNNLYDKFVHFVNSGYDDKHIAKNLIKRWAIQGNAYTKHDIAKMREMIR